MSNGTVSSRVRGSTRLRELLSGKELIVAPGVFDGISARAALAENFDCLYATGAGMTASRLGLPDLAYASQDDFVAQGGMIASLSPSTPLICDADTGFGSPLQIFRTVARYDQAGIAGFHIEDQFMNKRCGHLANKQIVSFDEFRTRIKAASEARRSIPGCDIVFIARSDAAQSYGLDEAIKRLKMAVAEGADAVFLEGLQSKEDVERTVKELAPTPVLLNLVPGGVTPPFTTMQAKEMGVRICIFPGGAFMAAHAAAASMYRHIKSEGTEETHYALKDQKSPLKDFFRAMGLDEAIRIDEKAGSGAFDKGV